MSTWAIGDVHGHASALDALLEYLPLRCEDQIVFLGDLIDRGPRTPDVLETVRRLQQEREVVLLRGNHEQMMLESKSDLTACRKWLLSGGDATADAYVAKTMDDIPAKVWAVIESTIPYFETESVVYVHANLDPFVEMSAQCENDLYWNFCTNPTPHMSGKFMVCGHTYQARGLQRLWPKAICIDTLRSDDGEGWITAVNIEKKAFWQVDAHGRKRMDSFMSLGCCPESDESHSS